MTNNLTNGRVFISYSQRDKVFVAELVKRLKEYGVDTWVDVGMNIGDSIHNRIQEAIADSAWFAVVLSENSVNSAWVQKELDAAFVSEVNGKKTFILPILHKECKIPLFLQTKLYADFTLQFEIGLNALLKVLVPDNVRSPEYDIPQHILLKYPVYPYVQGYDIPTTLIRAISNAITDKEDMGLIVNEANAFRRAANPREDGVTTIQKGLLPPSASVAPLAYWSAVFTEACKNGPRMTAALLLSIPDYNFTDEARQQKITALNKLINYK